MNIMKRLAAFFMAATVITISVSTHVYAEELPYDTYTYTYWEDIAITPRRMCQMAVSLGFLWEQRVLRNRRICVWRQMGLSMWQTQKIIGLSCLAQI